MDKYNLDLSKNLPGLNHKKGLCTEKYICGAFIGPLMKRALDSGIEGGANKKKVGGRS